MDKLKKEIREVELKWVGVIGVQGLYAVVLVMMKMAEGGDSNPTLPSSS